MEKIKKQLMVPFDSKGNHQTWAYREDEFHKPNFEFEATLIYNGFSRGRSSLNISWKDKKTGKTFESGMKLLDETCSGSNFNKLSSWGFLGQNLMIKGNFTFKKQGTSVLLTLI